MTDLGAFLHDNLARRRQAGEWDCATFAAGWAVKCGSADPMADMRGQYDSEARAQRIIRAAGGLAELVGPRLEAIGARPVAAQDAAPGDIAVADFLGLEALAICAGERWAYVATRGLGFVSLPWHQLPQVWRLGAHG